MYTIVGATGKVGSKIAMILLRMGENVRMISRNEERLKPFVAQGATPFVGDVTDTEFLTSAFSEAEAVFVMIPPHYGTPDFGAYQDAIGQSITTAVQQAKMRYVVNLSSVGAELPEGTGPISGLHRQEERLNRIPGLNVLHIRAAYFMENLLMNIPLIRSSGIMGSAILGDLNIPMIATTDIAEEAAERLLNRDFSGTSIQYLL
ncbi:MAG TPA: NAD(P)H-binding protein, partial [Nitrospirota bacterium]|nr:NAD(P)H-binding protein [Nitrospirota bacterium]